MAKPIELKLNIDIAHKPAYAPVEFQPLALGGLGENTKNVIY